MCYDTARQRMVVFGGMLCVGSLCRPAADTLEWDGSQWIVRNTTGPVARNGHVLFHDPLRERTVLFGGTTSTDLWEYGPTHAAGTAILGAGCSGTHGTPTLLPATGQRPWLGEPFTLELANVPPLAASLLLLGHSKKTWSGVPLPFDLAALGAPGCSVWSSGQVHMVLLNGAGVARWTVTLCACPELLGQPFFTQGLVPDAAANPLGLVVSNAIEARFGGK
jgi:hypothetical protein